MVNTVNNPSPDAAHSQAHTPSQHYASLSSSLSSSSSSRSSFRFSASKLGRQQTADNVSLETVYCVGCEGYVPVPDLLAHLDDCSATAMTTPDQRLAVLLPYEAGKDDEMVPGLTWREQWERAGRKRRRADRLTLDERKQEEKRRTAALERLRLQTAAATDGEPQAGGVASEQSPSAPAAARRDAAVTVPAPAPFRIVQGSTPDPVLSALPSPPVITRFFRFLPPKLFSSLLCGCPQLSPVSFSSPRYERFCLTLRTRCRQHEGWEAAWREQRRRRRAQLAGRMRALAEDMQAALSWMDVQAERKRGEAEEGGAGGLRESGAGRDADAVHGNDSEEAADDEVGFGLDDRRHSRRRLSEAGSLDSSSEESDDSDAGSDSLSPLGSGGLSRSALSLSAANGSAASKKEKDRERVRERERLNKQRQRERAKAREREKELRLREKERVREKKRERKKKAKEKERRDRERRRDRDRERDRDRDREKERDKQQKKKKSSSGNAGGGAGGSSRKDGSSSGGRRAVDSDSSEQDEEERSSSSSSSDFISEDSQY